MNTEQALVSAVLAVTMAFFVWGRWRYDVVALIALLVAVGLGLVPSYAAFHGFGHPALITVAAVLVISQGLQSAGVVERITRYLALTRRTTILQIGASSSLTAVLSAFMNNIGALALMLPAVLRNTRRSRCTPRMILMPVAFASLLGGLTTLIGTPPNIIIAAIRSEYSGEPFSMFDFAYVGLPVALLGVAFVSFIGWRLLPGPPESSTAPRQRFRIDDYTYQATIPPDSALVGARVRDLRERCANAVTVTAIIRGRRRITAPAQAQALEAGDIVLLQGDADALNPLLESAGLVHLGSEAVDASTIHAPGGHVVEVVVMPGSPLLGGSMRGLRVFERFGLNLLALARHGERSLTRLGSVRFRVGDVLLLHGTEAMLHTSVPLLRCLPLGGRDALLGQPARKALLALAAFAIAISLTAIAGIPPQLTFVGAALVYVLANIVSLRDAYQSIEWPVLVLLGALLPIGEALHSTGASLLIAQWTVQMAAHVPLAVLVGGLILVSMILSDLVHNSPTAVLMAPIAIDIAAELQLPPDGLLMAVAIGAASPYLTPIGHPSNTLVMGPGGYQFSEYWRMGLPLDGLIIVTAVPMILWVWMP